MTAFYSIIFIQQYNNWIHLFIDRYLLQSKMSPGRRPSLLTGKALNRSSLTQRDAPADGWMSRQGIKRRKNRNVANKHAFLTLNFGINDVTLAKD